MNYYFDRNQYATHMLVVYTMYTNTQGYSGAPVKNSRWLSDMAVLMAVSVAGACVVLTSMAMA
jgi:hypothetical protein